MEIRRAQPADLPALVGLCRDHARFEGAAIREPEPEHLHAALFGNAPKLHAFVAVDHDDHLIGYATATVDYSTWQAREYMHLDCLYLIEAVRSQGVGQALVDAVVALARELGIEQLQWQTPQWNTRAQRFYERLGATTEPKLRFTLRV
jgi:ribosomal protein S18 acetylase RimI-like enzyme